MTIHPTRLKNLRKLIRHGAISRVARMAAKIHPADIARLFSELNPIETLQLVEALIVARRAGVTFLELPIETLQRVLALISDDRLAQVIERQHSDDGVFFLSLLSPNRREAIRSLLSPEQSAVLWNMLRYPRDTAGSVMNTRALAMREQATVEEAIAEIRRQGKALELIFYLYVVDENDVLKGVVPLRQLILAEGDRPLSELMIDHPVSVNALDDQKAVADLVAKYNFLAVPVTDEAGRLLGVVTVDDVIDVIHDEASQDFYHMAGLEEADRVYGSIFRSYRKRIVWTAINLATAFAASLVVGFFEGSIEKVVALATFMPIVAGLGGNSGTQSLAVFVRGIALGELDYRSAIRAVLRQFGVGVLVGASAGLITAGAVFAWKGNPWLGLVLFLSMLANMALGALVGAAVPLLLRVFRQDPALGSGILVTGITDSLGFLFFLGLATLFLTQIG